MTGNWEERIAMDTDGEIAEFIQADALDPETRAIAERFLGGSWT